MARRKLQRIGLPAAVSGALAAVAALGGEQVSAPVLRVTQVIEQFVVDIPVESDDPLFQPRQQMLVVDRFDAGEVLDLATLDTFELQIGVRRGNGDGTFGEASIVEAAGFDPVAIVAADFASPFSSGGGPDGNLDLAEIDSFGEVFFHLGNVLGNFPPEPEIQIDLADFGLLALDLFGGAAGDFDGAEGADLALLDIDVIFFLCNDGGFISPCATSDVFFEEVSTGGSALIDIALGDFDGDGAADVAALDAESDRVFFAFGDGAGGFVAADPVTVGSEVSLPVDFFVGELNGDGRDDLIVVGRSDAPRMSGRLLVALAGERGFQVTDLVLPANAASGAVEDFDAGGILDLAIGTRGGDGVLFFVSGESSAQLNLPFEFDADGIPGRTMANAAVLVSEDLDGDGITDLVALVGDGDEIEVAVGGGTAPVVCPGDCDGDGEVSINELIRGVNIALGNATADQCPAFDRNADGQVGINELIQAVNAALGGCPG